MRTPRRSAVTAITGAPLSRVPPSRGAHQLSNSAQALGWPLLTGRYSPIITPYADLSHTPLWSTLRSRTGASTSLMPRDVLELGGDGRMRVDLAKTIFELADLSPAPKLWMKQRARPWSPGHEYLTVTATRTLSGKAVEFSLAERQNMLRAKARIVLPNSYDMPLDMADGYEKAAAGWRFKDWKRWRQIVPDERRAELEQLNRDNWRNREPMSDGATPRFAQRLGSNIVYPQWHLSTVHGDLVVNTVVMAVSTEHMLRGQAMWFDILDLKTGKSVGAVLGAGRTAVPFVDAVNSVLSAPLWAVTHDLAQVVLEDEELRDLAERGQLDGTFYSKLLEKAGPELARVARTLSALDCFSFVVTGANRQLDTVEPDNDQVKRASDFMDEHSDGTGLEIELVEVEDEDALDADSPIYQELPQAAAADSDSDAQQGDDSGDGDILDAGGDGADDGDGGIHDGSEHGSATTDPDGGQTTEPSGDGEHDEGHEDEGHEGERGGV